MVSFFDLFRVYGEQRFHSNCTMPMSECLSFLSTIFYKYDYELQGPTIFFVRPIGMSLIQCPN